MQADIASGRNRSQRTALSVGSNSAPGRGAAGGLIGCTAVSIVAGAVALNAPLAFDIADLNWMRRPWMSRPLPWLSV